MKHILHATAVRLACTLLLVGCAQSVRVLAPPPADQRPEVAVPNPVTFSVAFHPRADVSTFKATLDPNAGYPTTGGADITSSFSQPFTAGGQSTATVTVPPFGSCLLSSNPDCILEHRLRVEADLRPGRAFDSTGQEHRFLLDEPPPGTGPPPPPPPSSPGLSLNVTPSQRTVQWGSGTGYQIELQGQNNFNGSVLVELRGSSGNPLPPGVSASPLSVTLTPQAPNATATLNVGTAAVATPTGSLPLQVRASSPGASTRTRNITLTVTRTPGIFEYRATSSSATSTCGNNLASATYGDIDPDPNNTDLRVTFVSAPPAGPSTQAIQAVYYLLSPPPACVGVALHPLIGVTGQPVPPALSWYNLGFSQNLGAPAIPGRIKNLPDINWHQFWFSQDQSLLVLVTKLPLPMPTPAMPTPVQSYRLFLYDAATGQEIDSTDITPRSVGTTADPIADICRVELNTAGDTVTATYRDRQNQPASCLFSANRSNCQTAAPQNCRVSTRDLNF